MPRFESLHDLDVKLYLHIHAPLSELYLASSSAYHFSGHFSSKDYFIDPLILEYAIIY